MRYIFLIFLVISVNLLHAAAPVQLSSPGKGLQATLSVQNGHLYYSVVSRGHVLIESSRLGMDLNGKSLGTQVQQLSVTKQYTIKETLPTRLNTNASSQHCIGYLITIKEAQTTYTIEFRLYNNACAFRYLPASAAVNKVAAELTAFTLPATSTVWFFERNNSWKLQSYAGLWSQTAIENLQTISSQGPVQGKPLVVQLPSKQYLLITEAALYNYSGLRFKVTGRTLQANFTEGEKGFEVNGPLTTPWRVVLYANDLNSLVNNHVIEHLNPAPDEKLFANSNYIHPGKAVWSWITRNENYMQPVEEQKMIDAAAKLNFEYSLLDEGWETTWPQKWQQLHELSKYAAAKNVKLWVWKHSKDLRDSSIRNAFLDSVAMAGAVGIKTDFMNSEAKPLIDFDEALLKAAAQRRLMVNFHGCQTPSGESRTYPNEMTREGIRGMELNIMKEHIPAWHNAALPFTRFVCGHGDYTPGFFSNKGATTYTHQLALLYLFNSPFQCVAENPVVLLENPLYQPILPLLKTLPVTWDETIVLPGSNIGTMAAFARRKGRDWYIAVINGTDSTATFTCSPSFLPAGRQFQAMVISDAGDNQAFNTKNLTIQSSGKQVFTIPPTGGLVIAVKRK